MRRRASCARPAGKRTSPLGEIPPIGILDPAGDMVRYLAATGQATRHSNWASYHTDLYRFEYVGLEFGIVGCAVGAAFAVSLI